MLEKPPPSNPASPAGRRFTDALEGQGTVIGPGTRIKGSLSGADAVDLSGVLEGPSTVSGLYQVRAGARVVGDITATSLVVEGDVAGRTLSAEKIEIGTGARVRANLRARVVAIAEGAFFDGQVHMEGRDGPAGPVHFKERRKPRAPEAQAPPPEQTPPVTPPVTPPDATE